MRVVAVQSWTQTRQIHLRNETDYYIKNNVSLPHLKRTLRNIKITDIVEDNCRFYFDVKDFLVSILQVPTESP
jgi:hypothetical protein